MPERDPKWAEVYELRADGKYYCRKDGSLILGRIVTVPVWDGPFPCSGSGMVESYQTPYCPKCEQNEKAR